MKYSIQYDDQALTYTVHVDKLPAEDIELILYGCGGTGEIAQKQVAELIKSHENTALLAINLGDMFYPYGVNAPDSAQFDSQFYDVYTDTLPHFVALGNHEYNYQKISYYLNRPVLDTIDSESFQTFRKDTHVLADSIKKDVKGGFGKFKQKVKKKVNKTSKLPAPFNQTSELPAPTKGFLPGAIRNKLEALDKAARVDAKQRGPKLATNLLNHKSRSILNTEQEKLNISKTGYYEIQIKDSPWGAPRMSIFVLDSNHFLKDPVQQAWIENKIINSTSKLNFIACHHPIVTHGKRANNTDDWQVYELEHDNYDHLTGRQEPKASYNDLFSQQLAETLHDYFPKVNGFIAAHDHHALLTRINGHPASPDVPHLDGAPDQIQIISGGGGGHLQPISHIKYDRAAGKDHDTQIPEYAVEAYGVWTLKENNSHVTLNFESYEQDEQPSIQPVSLCEFSYNSDGILSEPLRETDETFKEAHKIASTTLIKDVKTASHKDEAALIKSTQTLFATTRRAAQKRQGFSNAANAKDNAQESMPAALAN